MSSKGPGLCEFLIEAELHQYFASFKNDLKIQNTSQLKYVTDEDLIQLGMSKPEIRRLKKYFQKHFPQTYLSKFKKMIMPKKDEPWENIVLPEETQEKPPVKVPNKHIIPAEAIIVNKELGTGEFGVVQQGVWTNDGNRIQVAIKCLSRERMQNNPIEFLKEAAIMHSIDHEHIVRLYGVVLDTNALMLVTELAALRSLLECLKEPSLRSSFPVLSLCNFAIQICDGMQYLEAKRLIHRDLAARNILVFSKNKVKISDFGLSRALGVGKDYYQTNYNVNLKLPIAWCAPESILYLKFTSASDVWAYAVTLWEMFSYGFQPWAALTGQQILDAIDLPNSQRLERPECCTKEYYAVMKKCWHHDPVKRPKFSDLMRQLPECKPEQVQAIQDSGDERLKRDSLVFKAGEIITVLDKNPTGGGSSLIGGSLVTGLWKGCTNSGKTGLFNPALTVSYLGSSLPSNKPSTPSDFTRGDGKNAYSSKRRLRPDMISCPQGEVKHTGHVGLDGAYFGDISFLGGSKYEHIPHQIVTPYKPQADNEDANSVTTDKAPLLANSKNYTNGNGLGNSWLDASSSSKLLSDHEYHEISDTDTPSPRFEKQFDFGRSLMDEMDEVLRNYSCPPTPLQAPPNGIGSSVAEDAVNKKNEMKEASSNIVMPPPPPQPQQSKHKKKQATVKPISAADEKTLDTAIALANELAARTMSNTAPVSPSATTPPTSASKHKFTFKFPGTGGHGSNSNSSNHKLSSSLRSEGRTFTDEAASIPDIQGCLTSEAKAVYSSLVETPVATDNPLRMLRTAGAYRGKQQRTATLPLRTQPTPQVNSGSTNCLLTADKEQTPPSTDEVDLHPEDENQGENGNAIPLPPRDRTRSLLLAGSKPRHERKHPLIIPTSIAQSLSQHHVSNQPQETFESEPAYLGLEEDPPESMPPSEPCPPLPDNINGNLEDESEDNEGFEEMIAEGFDLLDKMEEGSGDESEDGGVVPPVVGVADSGSVDTGDTTSTVVESDRRFEEIGDDDSRPPSTPPPPTPPADSTLPPVGKVSALVDSIDCKEELKAQLAIMARVLHNKVSEDECLKALECTGGNVHRGIKLARLVSLVGGANASVESLLEVLEASSWDVAAAAASHLATVTSDAARL